MSETNENMVPENNEAMESNDSGSTGGLETAVSGLVGLGTGLFGGSKIGRSRERTRILNKIHEVVDEESYKRIEAAVTAKPEKKKKEKKPKGKFHIFYREPVVIDDSGTKPDAANGESQKKEEETSEEAK